MSTNWWQEGAILRAVHASLISYPNTNTNTKTPTPHPCTSALLISASLSRDPIYAGYAREADASAAIGGDDSLISAAFDAASSNNREESNTNLFLLRVDDLLSGETLEGDSYEDAFDTYFLDHDINEEELKEDGDGGQVEKEEGKY